MCIRDRAIGLEQDEYGEYPCRYHTALLGMYGIYAVSYTHLSDKFRRWERKNLY